MVVDGVASTITLESGPHSSTRSTDISYCSQSKRTAKFRMGVEVLVAHQGGVVGGEVHVRRRGGLGSLRPSRTQRRGHGVPVVAEDEKNDEEVSRAAKV